MKWDRQEYIDLMTFGDAKRPMLCELFGLLIGLEAEWVAQGASEDEISLKAFDFDYLDLINCGGMIGFLGNNESQILEDTKEYTITLDSLGRKMKLCKGYATIPLPLNYPVKNFDDWLKIKDRLVFSDERINRQQLEAAKIKQSQGALTIAGIPGGFDLPRQLMGEEGVCYCYYDNPDLIRDIMETIGDTCYKVFDIISDEIVIDNLQVHEDMAGKSGSLIGPDMINEFIKPYYLKIWKMLESKGTKIFSQDSDGNMNSVIDCFIESGVNVMFPLEPAAGMDIVELRKKYGNKLALKGGIDKHVLRQDKNSILKELEYKMQACMLNSGIAFSLDHRIPNGTPFENYKFYVNMAREILGLSSISSISKNKGWAGMAF